MGGGRRNFLPNTTVDPEYNTTTGWRKDGLDLTTVCVALIRLFVLIGIGIMRFNTTFNNSSVI